MYGDRYILNSPDHGKLMRLFHGECERYGIVHNNDAIFAYLNAFEEKERYIQPSLFE